MVKKSIVTEMHRQEAERLRQIWDREPRPSQAAFGKMYGIGTQSAVGQFLRGDIPLSFKAAKGFAKGLGCRIADFSPRLSDEMLERPPGKPFPLTSRQLSAWITDQWERFFDAAYRDMEKCNMTDPQFEDLCRLYGFAPSRDLRSLLDAAVQMDRRNSLAPAKTTCKVCGIERAHGIGKPNE